MCDKSKDKIFGEVKKEHWWFLQHFHMCKLKDEDQQAMWRLSVMIVQITKIDSGWLDPVDMLQMS